MNFPTLIGYRPGDDEYERMVASVGRLDDDGCDDASGGRAVRLRTGDAEREMGRPGRERERRTLGWWRAGRQRRALHGLE